MHATLQSHRFRSVSLCARADLAVSLTSRFARGSHRTGAVCKRRRRLILRRTVLSGTTGAEVDIGTADMMVDCELIKDGSVGDPQGPGASLVQGCCRVVSSTSMLQRSPP